MSDEEHVTEDVTRALDGNERKFYAFGKWKYLGTDYHKIIINDKFGKKELDCDQIDGQHDQTCDVWCTYTDGVSRCKKRFQNTGNP